MPENNHWEHFAHSADIGIRGYGDSLAFAFEQTALAMTAVICDPDKVHSNTPVQIRCQASDHELLLVDWLNSIIYEMATRKMLFSRYEVMIQDDTLNATIWGEAVDRKKHRPAVEVKGATYTELKVTQQKSGEWICQCVVDV